ncbi:MAG TPA: M6 family metalloprotease domain-containing protein [Gemmatimonadales bacterium]|jgi:M6 family metalloprotease-like protein|nr:M6 family metalloprotease domain-containing protein [Gemmatimonadales bacterium]
MRRGALQSGYILALVLLLPAARAHAQGGGSVPVLIEPADFSPTGAWRRRAAQVRGRRMELLRAGDLRALNSIPGRLLRAPLLVAPGGVASAVTGAFHVPVIAIAYKDVPVQFPVADYQCLLFSQSPVECPADGWTSSRPYSVSTFYEEMSHHRITMDGVVFAPVRVDSNAAFYTDGCNAITVNGQTSCPSRPLNRMAVMLIAALDSISNRPGGDTVWSRFDNDGPDGLPNSGDDDGVVDFVTFLQPEVGGECRQNVPLPTGVWSHRFFVSGWTGEAYTTKTPRRGANGLPLPGQFIKVNDYTIQSQRGGITSCDGSAIMAVGTVAHETGHAFGLPDLYDTSGRTQGIGGWGLMGSGNYARPYSPSSYDAWSLNQLGWATVDTLGGSRTVTTGPRLLTDTIYYAPSPAPEEYVLVENRQAVLSDTAQMNPILPPTCPMLGFCAKSPGLLLWLIDQPRVDQGLLTNSVNAGAPQGVQLMQADGLNQLLTLGSRNRGDRGDAYPGSTNNTRFMLLSSPAARTNFGGYLGFGIDRIEALGGGVVRFRFTRREPSVVEAVGGAMVRVNGQPTPRYEEVVPAGDLLQIGVDSVQLIDGGKSRAGFIAWSRGGPREQTITSGAAKPDTLSATFNYERRLLLATVGAGTVAASVAGDVSQGVYLQTGTHVTLTASTPTGSVFAGWRGDTVATAPTLELTMTKGYDLEARFVGLVQVVLADAVSDLLGTPRLTDTQRDFLDQLGNRSGVFDLGDLLAMYRRAGLAAPAAVLQAGVRGPAAAGGGVAPARPASERKP